MPIPVAYSLRSIAVRKGSSAMAVFGIALVVIVFITLLALAAGFERAVKASGDPRNIICLRKGADAELQSQVNREAGRILTEMPFVASGPDGRKLFCNESVTILSRPKRDGGDTNITVRGTTDLARAVHTEVKLVRGRWLTPGSDEAVIGSALARRLEGFEAGETVVAGRRPWRIVGVFDAQGSALESEMWIDAETFQSVFNRGNIFQSLLFRADGDPAGIKKQIEKLAEDDPRLQSLQPWLEKEYYEKQAKLMSDVITILGNILSAIMSIGAIVGASNTMYAAVSQRKREIGCLLSMGFTPESIWIAFILESLLISALGAIIGCSVAMLFNGMKTGTTNWVSFSETAFEFNITWLILLKASGLALFMGFIGGFLPALRAARMKVVEALRRA